jgi:hypothetical protein
MNLEQYIKAFNYYNKKFNESKRVKTKEKYLNLMTLLHNNFFNL